MKKIFKRITSAIMCCVLIFSCTGCFSWGDTKPQTTEFNFFKLSQEKRNEYVLNYLEEKYGEEYEILSDVERNQETYFSLTNYCTGSVVPKSKANIEISSFIDISNRCRETIYVWVDKGGNITDSAFLSEFQDEFHEIYCDILKETYPECVIYSATAAAGQPNRSWKQGEDARALLETEDVFAIIDVVVNKSEEMTEEEFDVLSDKIDFCAGIITVYEVDDINDVDDVLSMTIADRKYLRRLPLYRYGIYDM